MLQVVHHPKNTAKMVHFGANGASLRQAQGRPIRQAQGRQGGWRCIESASPREMPGVGRSALVQRSQASLPAPDVIRDHPILFALIGSSSREVQAGSERL